ncbi:MAG: hypothetical protein ABIL20_02715 [candidate division WOR-3 bacterium]
MLEPNILEKIKKKINKQFPDFKGIEPKVVKKKITPQKNVYKKLSLGAPENIRTVFSLHFVKKVKTVDAVVIKQILVVTANESGEIVKISQSK